MPESSAKVAAKDNNSDAELVSLKQQRSVVKRHITNVKRKLEVDVDTSDVTILECRLQVLEAHFKQISHLQTQIEKLTPLDEDTARSDFEELFIGTKAKILSSLNRRRGSVQVEQSLNTTVNGIYNQHRLPSLKLPRFEGKYADYIRFITSFKNMVDDNASLTSVDKFNYLLNCLSGAALAVVEPFQITDANYPKALKRLEERYNNKVLIFSEQITAFFNISCMSKGDGGSLRSLIDTIAAIRGSLLSSGSAAEVMDGIIIYIALSKLDADTKRSYDENQDFQLMPSWDRCYDFLSRRCQYLECHGSKTACTENTKTFKPKHNGIKSSAQSFVTLATSCSFCKGEGHIIGGCPEFAKLVVSERFDFVKRNGHCVNCLRKGHVISKCFSKARCRVCNKAHHSILHIYQPTLQQEPSSSSAVSNQLSGNPTALMAQSFKRAIIPTAVILIADNCGSFIPARVLLDSCSEINFITENLAKILKLKLKPEGQTINGIGEVQTSVKHSVKTTIKSRVTQFQWTSTFAVTKKISTHQPSEYIGTTDWNIPSTIQLADPLFYKPQKVDLLISTEIFLDLLLEGHLSLGTGKPSLKNTVFGWIVGGKYVHSTISSPLTCNVAITTQADEKLSHTLQQFWKIEDYSNEMEIYSEEEQLCERHFVDNVEITDDGRVQVRLPFKLDPHCLGESFQNSRRRLLALERKLSRDSHIQSMYVDFMNEYMLLGHMSLYNQNLEQPHYIIPHHCVLRPESTSTKLRVVFDASAKTSSGQSLNEILMVGPTIQQDLITTMFSFRLHKYALTADISKMYRQFEIDPQDRKYQLILWRSCPNEPIQLYQLNTVTYGLSAAPFLAIRCLFFIADKHASSHPIGAKILKDDLYVDDVLTGSNTIDSLKEKKHQLIEILQFHGLQLAKWNSNSPQLVPNPDREISLKVSDLDITKALGMSWKPQQDIFLFRFDLPDIHNPTKRSVMSIVAKIFDLLGLLSPITIRCKIFLQQLWIQNVDWDEPLNQHLLDLWFHIKEDLAHLHQIEVPRYVLTTPNVMGEVHGFADASQKAFGCCLYFRVLDTGSYRCSLLISKSKVAPIKAQSLPRLELCAAVLLNRTWKKIQSKMSPFCSSIVFWTDSKIVLQWLKHHSSTLNCFVANRISELQEETANITWRHVPTKSNPADIVSRGCTAAELPSTIWFDGPSFLYEDSSKWPPNIDCTKTDVVEKRKATVFTCTTNLVADSIVEQIIDKFSANKSLNPIDATHIPVTELANTFLIVVAHIQAIHYAAEIESIENGKLLQPSLQKLAVFIQNVTVGNKSVKILRVGGRLCKAPIPYDAKFPILLPKNHRFVKLYIDFLHKHHLHAGPKVLLGLLRQRIWVINARELIRKAVRNCVHCFRYKPKLMEQIMGNLPADRLLNQTPFVVTGVDFCGPFLTSHRIRGKAPYKTYVAVFVCFVSKATHLELVSNLSSDTFLLCLKRFVSRRGAPQRIYCDNATNFLGASNELQQLKAILLNQDVINDIKSYSSKAGFDFCFIPPRAPHFGGLWEAAVKSAKTLLVKNLSEARLSYEEFQTLLTEVEAILNSRPIAPMSNDPNDGEALTPGHLLIGKSIVAVPEDTNYHQNSKISSLSRYQQITFLKKQFWDSWSRDYLLSLQQRAKWSKPQQNLSVGQLVIIHEDHTPPQRWLLARITETISGSDGKVRVARLKTKNGLCTRPIHKLAPVPVEDLP